MKLVNKTRKEDASWLREREGEKKKYDNDEGKEDRGVREMRNRVWLKESNGAGG